MRRRLMGGTAALPLAVTLALTLASTGCGGGSAGGGVASAGTAAGAGAAASSAPPEELSDDERNLKFAACLREQGLDVPDPEPGGGFVFRGGDGAADRETVRAAMEACAEYSPNGGEPPQLNPEQAERVRQLAKCMRENGVPDFPDPSAEGGIRLGPGDIDPDDPAVRAAFETCEEFMPNIRNRGGNS